MTKFPKALYLAKGGRLTMTRQASRFTQDVRLINTLFASRFARGRRFTNSPRAFLPLCSLDVVGY